MYWLLILQQLIPSTTHIVSKDISGVLPVELVLLIRAAIASLVFFAWMIFSKQLFNKIESKDWIKYLILAALNIPINQMLFFNAVKLTSPANLALAYALSPVFVLILSKIFQKQSYSIAVSIGIAIALLGSAIIQFEKGLTFASENFLGNLLALGSSFTWSIYTIIGQNLVKKYGAFFSTASSVILGCLMFLIIFLFINPEYPLSEIKSIQWIELIYLGAGASVFGYGLWFVALRKIEAAKVAIFNNLQPILTTIMSLIFFSIVPSIQFMLGGALIIGGVVLAQLKNK